MSEEHKQTHATSNRTFLHTIIQPSGWRQRGHLVVRVARVVRVAIVIRVARIIVISGALCLWTAQNASDFTLDIDTTEQYKA